MGEQTARRTRARGDRSRHLVLVQAAQLATIEGLEGLSVGRIAEASGMPKSSVYELFGSKEGLQLATINAARDSFVEEVVAPALVSASPGRDLLCALCDGFLSYVERRVFPGGCFFVGVAAEMGPRAGRIRDRVIEVQGEWREGLLDQSREAAARDELPEGTDPDQLAFELGALLAGTNIYSVLYEDFAVIDRARAAVRTHLGLPSGA